MSLSDTSCAAQEVQLRVQQAVSGEQRLLLAFAMSQFTRGLATEQIRRDHPEWDERQVARGSATRIVVQHHRPGHRPED